MAGAGYKLFNTGDVLTAAQVNTYLQEQAVMRFANSTARTTALSGVLAEGMMSYLDDTNSVEVYNGTSWVNVGNAGDITEVQAGTGISVASGTGPIPVVTNTVATTFDAAGDLIYGTGADTFTKLSIGTAGQVLKVNSGATAPEWGAAAAAPFVGCYAGKTATQSIANTTYTAITFDTESYDTDSIHSTVTNTSRFTVPTGKGGKWLVTATAAFASNATGYRVLRLYNNGTGLVSISTQVAVSGDNTSICGAFVYNFTAGDYLEAFVYQNSGGNLNLQFADTTLQFTYLGA